jgi:hypothetical protein
MSEFEPRTEVEKEELGLYQEHKETNMDRVCKIAWVLVVLSLVIAITYQLNK